MRNILILGGNGFIGKNLCHYCLKMGDNVTSFDMTHTGPLDPSIHYVDGDFFDDYTLSNLVNGFDVVYHCISTLNPGNSNDKYVLGYERDFIQSVKLLSYISEMDSQLIFLSSGGTVYGRQAVQPITEEAHPSPINHYGNVKLCIENTLQTVNFQKHKKMLIARISNPYGPGQNYLKGVGFIDAAIKRTLANQPITIFGDGNTIRDYIYIDDVCHMLYNLSNYHGEETVFNISSGVGTSQNEILSILKNRASLSVTYTEERSVDVKRIILDNTKIMSLEPFQLTSIETGINKYYDSIVLGD